MLASMDNLNNTLHMRHFSASKSLSPNFKEEKTQFFPAKRPERRRSISVDRMTAVGNRLSSPTVSSNMKFRAGSEMQLNMKRTSSNSSLVSTGKASSKSKTRKQSLSLNAKEFDDAVTKKIKNLAGRLSRINMFLVLVVPYPVKYSGGFKGAKPLGKLLAQLSQTNPEMASH